MASSDEEVVGFTDAPSEDESKDLTTLGRELYATDSEIQRLEQQLEERKDRRRVLVEKELPDYLTRVGQDSVGLPEFGVDLVLENYYHANIASDWEPERRQAAFDWLEENGDGDMIKTEFTILFPKFMLPVARWLQTHVKTLRPKMTVSEEIGSGKKKRKTQVEKQVEIPEATVGLTVPWNTLTAWAKRKIEAGETLPLDVLGVTTGRIVKIKERDKPKKVRQ